MKNKYYKETNRRDFIKQGLLTAGAFMIAPRHVLGKGYIAPSDKLNLASIGAGGKGTSDIINAYNNGRENIVALCDVDMAQCSLSLKTFPKAKFFTDFRVMLDKMGKDIDGITISAPDHIHAVAAMAAMQLGISVYVQKPLTHNIYEARKLTEAAKRYKVITQMGNQGASSAAQLQMADWFKNDRIGQVDTIYVWTNRPVWPQGIPVPKDKPALPKSMTKESWDLFIGPASYVDYHPLYHPFKWRGWWNFGTGALGDIGCHTIDIPFRHLGLGFPKEVECSVGQVFLKDWIPEYIPEGCPPSSYIQLKFDATEKNTFPIDMHWFDGGIRPPRPELIPADDVIGDPDGNNGVMMIGETGIITCGMYGSYPKLYLDNGEVIVGDPNFPTTNPYVSLPDFGHQVLWCDAIKAGYGSKEQQGLTSAFEYAGPLTEAVLISNLAVRSFMKRDIDSNGNHVYRGRKKLIWDATQMKVTNYDEANQYVSRTYRNGWKLE